MPKQLFCCVDGGGSKTQVALFDDRGRRLGLTTAGPTSLTLYGAQAWEIIAAAAQGLCATVGLAPGAPGDFSDMHFGIGLAGANDAAQRARFIDGAPAVGALRVATDAYIAALGAHGGAAGAIIIVGTGSVGYCIEAPGRSRLVGGWGFPIGDEGSGAWLGRAALAQAIHVSEGRDAERATDLHRTLIEHCGGSRDAILGWLHGASSTRFAELAPLVIDHAGRGDAAAVRLATAAGIEIDALAETLDPGRQVPLSLAGGLAQPLMPYLPTPLQDWIQEPQDEPVAGALLLAQGQAPDENLARGGE